MLVARAPNPPCQSTIITPPPQKAARGRPRAVCKDIGWDRTPRRAPRVNATLKLWRSNKFPRPTPRTRTRRHPSLSGKPVANRGSPRSVGRTSGCSQRGQVAMYNAGCPRVIEVFSMRVKSSFRRCKSSFFFYFNLSLAVQQASRKTTMPPRPMPPNPVPESPITQ